MNQKKRSCSQINDIELYTKRLKLSHETSTIESSSIKIEKIITNQSNKINLILDNINNKLSKLETKLNSIERNLNSLTENYNCLLNNYIIKRPINNYQSLYIS